jgi:hypothetical protein
MIKSEIRRENLKRYKDTSYTKPRRNVKESEVTANPDLIPAIKLLHAIYLDNMAQTAKSTVV